MAGAAKAKAEQEREQERQAALARSHASSRHSHAASHAASHHGSGSKSTTSSSSGPRSSAPRSTAGSLNSARSRSLYRYNMDGNASQPSSAGERNPATARPIVDPRRFDLAVSGWSAVRGYQLPNAMPPRPKPSTLGQAAKVGLNSFKVDLKGAKPVYQFDVLIGNGLEKRGLVKEVWACQSVRDALGKGWIFDGNKLAWSMKPIDRAIKITLDMDKERGRTPKPGKTSEPLRVCVRQTNRVRMDVLDAYIDGRISFDNACLEAINCLDHVLREYPSNKYTQIKRSFFARGEQRFSLGGGVEAFKGV
ncbi:hypothetical protein KC317_g14508, partial [Hortaea werneckii]